MSTSSWLRPPQLSVDVGQRESHWYMKNITHLRSPCLPLALVARECPLVTERAVRLEGALLSGDLAGSFRSGGRGDGDTCASGLSLEVVSLHQNPV